MRIARALFTESEMNELASAFEDNADLEDDAEDDTEESLEDDNDFSFSLEDLMALAAELEGENSESNVARRSDDASEKTPATDDDFSLEDLMNLAEFLEQEGDLEGDDEFEENDLQAAFADLFENEEPEAEW